MRRVLFAASLLLLLGAVRAAVPAPSRPSPLARPSPTSAPLDDDTAREILENLDRTRAQAFTDPGSADPLGWLARSCPCLEAEQTQLTALSKRGSHLAGARRILVSVTVIAADATRADVEVVDRIPAYAEVARKTEHHAGRGPRRWLIVLVRTPAWRIADIEALRTPTE